MARKKSQQPNVGAWLGGNRGYVQSGSNTDTSAKIDAGGGQMEQVRAELGLGAYVAGVGATAAIGAGIAAARSGVGARAVNKLTGQQVMIHASPTRGLTQIDPRSGSRALPKETVVFGFDTKAELFPTQGAALMPGQVHQKATSRGSVYVVKTPRQSVRDRSSDVGDYVLTSTAPAKVVKELPIPEGVGQIRTPQVEAYDVALRTAVQRAGGKLAKQNRVTRKTVKRK